MKKISFQKMIYLLLFTLVILSLSSCGDISKSSNNTNSNSTKLSNEPIPISKAFSQEGIWFQYSKKNPIGKDEKIERILFFDGNGNGTIYKMNDLTFGDIKEMNRNQILELAAGQDREFFQNAFDSKKESYLNILKKYLDYANSENSKPELSLLVNLVKDFVEDMVFSYKGPSPSPYTLKARTDRTGNHINEELIHFEHLSYDIYENKDSYLEPFTVLIQSQYEISRGLMDEDIEKLNVLFEKLDKSEYGLLQIFPDRVSTSYNYELTPDYSVSQVYDKYFRGFHGFVTLTEDSTHPGFMFDTVSTEGIILDEE